MRELLVQNKKLFTQTNKLITNVYISDNIIVLFFFSQICLFLDLRKFMLFYNEIVG